jgi:hypothetical protein
MAKDKRDKDTKDWIEDAYERRVKEELEHARRRERHERIRSKTPPKDSR